MEFFAIIAFVFALIALSNASSASNKIRKLESKIKRLEKKKNGGIAEMARLVNELKGKKCRIISECLTSFTGTLISECEILDVDDEWLKVKVRNEKKSIETIKLLKIEVIDSIEVFE